MPFRPALKRFGLEDRCRERGPRMEAMVRFELTPCCVRNSRSPSWSYIADCWPGREVTRLLELHGPRQSPFCRDGVTPR